MTIKTSILGHAIGLMLVVQGPVALAQDLQQSLANRLPNVEKLLTQSSGARQIIDGGSDAARQQRLEALELLTRAREKYDSGDFSASDRLLKQSSRLMFAAIRQAAPTSIAVDHEKSTYDQRRESVMALGEAFNRIVDEINDNDSRQKVNQQLQRLIEDADALLVQGDNAGARGEIDKAYHLLKVSIESIRSGQTLVRSLQFASKREEYDYEVDRNDTHSMLIGLLVDQEQKSEYTQKQIVDFVAQASLLRRQAEAYAGDDAYEQAIELLEQSTRQLVRAIRSAGVYIPG